MTAHLHNRVIQQIGRALIRARQQDTNTSNSLDNAIASSESENNDTPDVEEEVNANMPDLNNNDNDDKTNLQIQERHPEQCLLVYPRIQLEVVLM